jgi:hypothetical protein
LSRPSKACYGLALSSLAVALWSALPPFGRRVDDWRAVSLLSTAQWMLLLAAAWAALPTIARWAWERRRWLRHWVFGLLASAVVLGIVFAVSVPSLLRARVGGLAVGGAKDVELFRASVREGYLPRASDITYEGVFYDYYFDTLDAGTDADAGATGEVQSEPLLFRPVFSWARLRDPLGGSPETFLALGLRSDLDTARIARKRLDLVVVLDISGSMGAPFRSYYHDSVGERDRWAMDGDPDAALTKLALAGRAIAAMLDRPRPHARGSHPRPACGQLIDPLASATRIPSPATWCV